MPLTLRRRLHWLALALVPSALLMGVTAHLAVDIASVPLLWAIPLGLYLLSFIMVFSLAALEVALAAADLPGRRTCRRGSHGSARRAADPDLVPLGAMHLAAFFLTAVVCHGAMAADRPASEHLTEYYLWMSVGGVLGGLLSRWWPRWFSRACWNTR